MLAGDNDEIPVWMAEADHCMINKALDALDAAADEEPLTICKVRAILEDIVEEWPECGDLRRHQLEMVPKSHIQLLWLLGACRDPKTGAPRVAPDGHLVCAFDPGAWLNRQKAKANAFRNYSPGDNNLDRQQRMKERNLSARMAGLQHLKGGFASDDDKLTHENKKTALAAEIEKHQKEASEYAAMRETSERLRQISAEERSARGEGRKWFRDGHRKFISGSQMLEKEHRTVAENARKAHDNFDKNRESRLRDNAKVIATHDIKEAVLRAVEFIHRQRAKINKIEKIALDAISRERDDKKINKYISYYVGKKNLDELENKQIGSEIAEPIVTDITEILKEYKTGISREIQQDEVPSSRHRHPLVSTSQREIELSQLSHHPPVSTSQRSHSMPWPPLPRSIHSTATPPEDRTPSPSPPFSRPVSPRSIHPLVSTSQRSHSMPWPPLPRSIHSTATPPEDITPSPLPPFSRPVSVRSKHLSAIDPSSDAPLHLPIKAGRSKGPERYDITSQGDSPAGSVQSTYFQEWPSSPRQQPTAISEQPRRWNRRPILPTSPLSSTSEPVFPFSPFS